MSELLSCGRFSAEPGRPKVAIVGGGVMGLSIGWRLAVAGCSVDVFEREQAGRAASWAAAGMLAAGVELEPGEELLYGLNRRSQELWPEFTAELQAAAGMGIGYRDEGTIVAALTRDDQEQIRFSYEMQREAGLDVTWLNGRDVREREPYLRPGVVGGLYSPGDHQVDNRRLVEALRAAFCKAGGRLHEETPVEAIDVERGRVRGVFAASGQIPADFVVLAAGPWSREIDGLPDAVRPPVRPIKGQMLSLQMDPREPLVRHVLWAPKIYLVPREDGRLIIGGTVEERGFDTRLTAGGMLSVLEAAWRAVPAIEELPIDETWVGFRPGSRDDAPILGPCEVDGLVFATGHHRNGILLTPVTADVVSRYIIGGRADEAFATFGIDRFERHEPTSPAVASRETA